MTLSVACQRGFAPGPPTALKIIARAKDRARARARTL